MSRRQDHHRDAGTHEIIGAEIANLEDEYKKMDH